MRECSQVASCAWQQKRGDRVVESLRLTSLGGALSTEGYRYKCAFRVNVTLPDGAKYGAYYKLQGETEAAQMQDARSIFNDADPFSTTHAQAVPS